MASLLLLQGTEGDGGVEEDRTPDLRIANAALSQLSYHPTRRRILALNGGGDNAIRIDEVVVDGNR